MFKWNGVHFFVVTWRWNRPTDNGPINKLSAHPIHFNIDHVHPNNLWGKLEAQITSEYCRIQKADLLLFVEDWKCYHLSSCLPAPSLCVFPFWKLNLLISNLVLFISKLKIVMFNKRFSFKFHTVFILYFSSHPIVHLEIQTFSYPIDSFI